MPRAFIEVVHGRYAGTVLRLAPGEVVRVGRSGVADVYLPDDPLLASVHLAFAMTDHACAVFDLQSRNGVLVNERPTLHAILRPGDRVFAGITEFEVTVQGDSTIDGVGPNLQPAGGHDTVMSRVGELLTAGSDHVYGVIDAAADSEAVSYCREIGLDAVSLYEGQTK
ncbi:MAG: FHA domain-containing protein, partial [Planctomycetota bacterium]